MSWSLATGVFPQQVEGLSSTAYWTMSESGAIGLFVSILAHELGHVVMAQRFDLHMRDITLFIFGSMAEMSEEPPSAKSEFSRLSAERVLLESLDGFCCDELSLM